MTISRMKISADTEAAVQLAPLPQSSADVDIAAVPDLIARGPIALTIVRCTVHVRPLHTDSTAAASFDSELAATPHWAPSGQYLQSGPPPHGPA